MSKPMSRARAGSGASCPSPPDHANGAIALETSTRHRNLPSRKRALLAAAIAALVAGCAASPKLSVDSAGQPITCQTVAWLETQGRPASIIEQRIRADAMQTLASLGYTEDAENPDCLVSGTVFVGSRPGAPASVGLGMGRWGGSSSSSVGVSMPVGGGTRTVGNLAIDVIDVERNAEIWRGTLENAFPTSDPSLDEIGFAVRRVLSSFPLRR